MIKDLMFGVSLLISDFVEEIQLKLAKGSLILQYNFPQNNLTHFTNLNSFIIIKNILPQHSQKPYLLDKFSSTQISV